MSLQCFARLYAADARNFEGMAESSIHLVVTSPPYPFVAMWDSLFQKLEPGIAWDFEAKKYHDAWEAMHRELDKVWKSLWELVVPGGFVCINIGDAARTFDEVFRLWPNGERVTRFFWTRGWDVLPRVIWRKTINAPTKFMGSGMLPAGAYVTLEHEHILIFRKPGKRFGSEEEKARRRLSALTWDERNRFFVDLWDLKGSRQTLNFEADRERSGAYPLEIPHRLIMMYSLEGDTVFDPFVGTGTTCVAALASARNSIGVDNDASLVEAVKHYLRGNDAFSAMSGAGSKRLTDFQEFCARATAQGKPALAHEHVSGLKVVSLQEREIAFRQVSEVLSDAEGCRASYRAARSDLLPLEFQ